MSSTGYTRVSTEDPDSPEAQTDVPEAEVVTTVNQAQTIPHAVAVTPVFSNPQTLCHTSQCRICLRPFQISQGDTQDSTWGRYCPACIIGTCRGCGTTFQRPLGTDPTDGNFYRCPKCRLSGVNAIMNSCNVM